MDTKWIRLSERRPTEADLPIILWNSGVPKAKWTATADALRSQMSLTCFSHWMPAPFGEPPREPTQAEIDERACIEFDTEAFESWMLNDPCAREIKRREFHQAWMLASGLARKHERAEIAKLLPRYHEHSPIELPSLTHKAIDAIRKRVNGGES